MPETQNSNGWNEWSKYVLKSLEDLDSDVRQLSTNIDQVKEALWIMKGKAAVWGSICGAVTGLIVTIAIKSI